MNWAPVFVTLVLGPFIAGSMMAGLIQAFTRETTGIFERWDNKTSIERQVLADAVKLLNIPPNSSGRTDGNLTGDGDHDGDSLTNTEELLAGLDPRNPDTDGDGVADGVEIIVGTDPAIPTDGGLGPESPSTNTPGIPASQLYLDNLVKTVNNTHLVETVSGTRVSFHIHADATLVGPTPKTLVIEDTLPTGIKFIQGQIGDGPGAQPITNWPQNFRFEFNQPGTRHIDIFFTAEVNGNGLIGNMAKAYELSNPINIISDTAFIMLEQNGQPIPPPTVITFIKQARLLGSTAWSNYVTAKPGEIVEFHIVAQVSGASVNLTDALPQGLQYQPGSLKLLFGLRDQQVPDLQLRAVFQEGYPLNLGVGTYELSFSAKVNADGTYAITNTASLKQSGKEINTRSATVISPR